MKTKVKYVQYLGEELNAFIPNKSYILVDEVSFSNVKYYLVINDFGYLTYVTKSKFSDVTMTYNEKYRPILVYKCNYSADEVIGYANSIEELRLYIKDKYKSNRKIPIRVLNLSKIK